MSHIPRRRAVAGCAVLLASLAVSVTACDSGHPLSASPYDASAHVSFSGIGQGGRLDPDQPIEIAARAAGGRITDVTVTDAAGRFVRGRLSDDGSRWRSTTPLAAGTHYTVRVSTENADGAPGRRTLEFDTPPADDLLRVSFGPDAGTYGVGQPVTAELSRPVRDREARTAVEGALRVDSRPRVDGSWHWVDDKTLHYRPRTYWPAGAAVEVRSTLDGVSIGDDLHGGASKPLRLRFGDRLEAITDAASHTMTVKRNGDVIRTIPVTTGKPGFDTRNGVKVILAKEAFVRMRSSTVGIAAGSSEAYDLPVRWATRVTWSGEYVHAAPWSRGSHGSANTSHGCTGMSEKDARWFFDTVRTGDVVRVVNSKGETMTPFDNGFGDWNLGWKQWRAGSALTGDRSETTAEDDGGPADTARLRPRA